MNKTFSLIVEPRLLTGHKTKTIRADGKIPGTLYGKGVESVSVSIPQDSFTSVYKEAGETHLLDLSCGGKTYPALIHVVQKNPVTRKVGHVEFLIVNLSQKLKTQVPVRIIGIAPAVKEGKGTLLVVLNDIEVETLPNAIPESLDVDVSSLVEVNAEIKVKDLPIPEGVSVLTSGDLTVAKVGAIVVEAAPVVVATETPTEGEVTPTTTTTTEPSEPEKQKQE
jgi:large subunit ribosomal protein L25